MNFMRLRWPHRLAAYARSVRLRSESQFNLHVKRNKSNMIINLISLVLIVAMTLVASEAVAQSPLHSAVYAADASKLDSLLRAGVDANMTDAEGKTPLHLAAMAGYIKIAEILLMQDASVNALDRNGNTPLYFARGPIACFLEEHEGIGGRQSVELSDVQVDSTGLSRGSTTLSLGTATGHDVMGLLGIPAGLMVENPSRTGWLEYDLVGGQVLVVYLEGIEVGRSINPQGDVTALRIVGRCDDRDLSN